MGHAGWKIRRPQEAKGLALVNHMLPLSLVTCTSCVLRFTLRGSCMISVHLYQLYRTFFFFQIRDTKVCLGNTVYIEHLVQRCDYMKSESEPSAWQTREELQSGLKHNLLTNKQKRARKESDGSIIKKMVIVQRIHITGRSRSVFQP